MFMIDNSVNRREHPPTPNQRLWCELPTSLLDIAALRHLQQFSLLCDTSLSPQPPFESYALLTSFLTIQKAGHI